MTTIQFTNSPLLPMTEYTLQRRTEQLIAEVKAHPHRDELLELIQEQRMDAMLDEYITIIN